MACKLTRREGGTFEGKIGARVQVDVRSDDPASTVRIAYGGDQDGEAPFEFTIGSGRNMLLVMAIGVQDNQWMTVVEVDAGDCRLKRFSWSKSNFFTTIPIEGI